MEAFQSDWIRVCRECHVHGKANHFKLTRSGETPSASQPIELQAARDACFQSGHVEALASLLSSKTKSQNWSRINNVRTLSLNYGALHGDALPRCVPALATLFTSSAICEVELFHTGLTNASASAIASVLCLKECRITRLKLGENHIGDTGAQALGAALRINASLQQLNLAGNQLTDIGIQYLAEGLAKNSCLTGLCLRNNPFGSAGVQALSNALRSPACAVTELQLKGANVGVSGAAALADVLRYDPQRGGAPLATLELEETQIGSQGAFMLANSVAVNQSLTKLNMNGNRVGDAGAAAFGVALSQNRTLTALGMRANGMSGKGAESLALGLQNNEVMTGLDVGDNQLGRAGAIALAKLLENEGRQNAVCGLQCVNLGGNQIDSDGIRALAGSLHSNTKLTHLDVSFNGCMDSDVNELARVLCNNSSLTRLCLAGSRFGASGYHALLRAMDGNKTLRSLTLNARGGAPFDPNVYPLRQTLVDRVEENKALWKEQQQTQQPLQPPTPTPVPAPAPAVCAAPASPLRVPSPEYAQQHQYVQQHRAAPLPTPPASCPMNVVLPEVDPRGLNARAIPFRPTRPQMMPHPNMPMHLHQMQQQMGGSMMQPVHQQMQPQMFFNNAGNVSINNVNLNVMPTTANCSQPRPMGVMRGQQFPVNVSFNGASAFAFSVMATQSAMFPQSPQSQQIQFQQQRQQHQQNQQQEMMAPLQRFASALQPQSPSSVAPSSKASSEATSPVKSPILFPHDMWTSGVGEEFAGGLGVCGSTGSMDLQGVVDAVLENALASVASGGVFCVEEERNVAPVINGGHA